MHDDRFGAEEPHVYSVEWSSREREYRVDGRWRRREERGVSLSHQRIVRSVLTCDYEVIEVAEVVADERGATRTSRTPLAGPVSC